MRAARVGARVSLLALLVSFSACGYALVGRGTVVDPSIKRIGVPLFKDSTGRTNLDQKVTQKVIEELLKRGRFEVVSQAIGVDALIEGELLRYDAAPVGFSDAGSRTEATRFAITLTARIKYAKVGQDEPIWANESFSFRDEYEMGDQSTFFDRELQAQERLATAFARSLVAAMLEAF